MTTRQIFNEPLFINKEQTTQGSTPLFVQKSEETSLLKRLIPSRQFIVQNYQPAEFTAYTARKQETDSRPKEMASGKKVYEGAIATSSSTIPFGTKVFVPELNKTFTVEDRLGPRIRKITEETGKHFFDIYQKDLKQAKEFGRQNLTFKIIK